jgi:uncharacterized protein YjdB
VVPTGSPVTPSTGSVATVTVTLEAASLIPGQTTQATAVSRTAGGTILTGQTITWSSGTPSVATVNSSTGVVTGVAATTLTVNGTPLEPAVDYTVDHTTGRVDINPIAIQTGANAVTTVVITYGVSADLNDDGITDFGDFLAFFNCYDVEDSCGDIDGNPGVDFGDFLQFFNSYDQSCS